MILVDEIEERIRQACMFFFGERVVLARIANIHDSESCRCVHTGCISRIIEAKIRGDRLLKRSFPAIGMPTNGKNV
jgi:hypothetical protein